MPRSPSAFTKAEAYARNQTALIVGGYGYIGSAIARALADHGHHVVIAGRNFYKAHALARDIDSTLVRASSIELDADHVPSIRKAVSTLATRSSSIDLLINCIGRQHEQPLLEVTEEAFDSILRTNLKAAMFLGQAVAQHQIAQGHRGKHLHLVSLRASLGYRNRGYSAFTASKGGLAALIRQHAAELGPAGITVNGIAPGIVQTPKNAHLTSNAESLQQLVAPIPLGRLVTPEDIARVAVFLCSADADFITGQVLYLDGGLTSCR